MLAGVLCLQVPPQKFWPAGFVAFSLPGALVFNFFFLLYWALRRSWLLALPLAVLLLGWNSGLLTGPQLLDVKTTGPVAAVEVLLRWSYYIEKALIPAMVETRAAADHLETVVTAEFWPLPTYRELLFLK